MMTPTSMIDQQPVDAGMDAVGERGECGECGDATDATDVSRVAKAPSGSSGPTPAKTTAAAARSIQNTPNARVGVGGGGGGHIPPARQRSSSSSSSLQRTLDMEHNDVLVRINARKAQIADARRRQEELSREIADLEGRGLANLGADEMDRVIEARDQAAGLASFVSEAEEQANEVDYLVATGDILFRYYNVVEHGDTGTGRCNRHRGVAPGSVAAGANTVTRRRGVVDGNGASSRALHRGARSSASAQRRGAANILKYFGAAVAEKDRAERLTSEERDRDDQKNRRMNVDDDAEDDDDDDDTGPQDRASLLEKYLTRINGRRAVSPAAKWLGDSDISHCPYCHGNRRVTLLHDGCVYCADCFTQDYILIDHEKPSYKDPPKEIIYYAYKRINHFNEWLNQIQGKETTEIPQHVYNDILCEIRKEKITNMATLRKDKVKSILKRLRINKYYEHVPHIIYRLNGLPVPHMPPELEERLRHMFCQIQVPFLDFAPPGRKNFLSYSYVLHKFMQLLEKDEYLPSFPLLKSREKLHVQDMIWKKICERLGWEFYPSV